MRKALFVGINTYDNYADLEGCVNDAIELSTVLQRHASGAPNFSTKTLTSAENEITDEVLDDAVQELFSGECDVALFYFAGHGYFDDTNDEGMLIAQNYKKKNGIRISDILGYANKATGIKNKVIILDCCEAGAAGQQKHLKGGESLIGDGVTILTACKKSQAAKEEAGQGVFTRLLIQALHGGAATVLGQVSPGNMYSFIDGALGPWEQRPVFKTSVSQFISLRDISPLVPLETLRQLPEWFPENESMFKLDPSFEPDHADYDPENGKIFKQLQKCNRHSLIDPVNEEHMYYAAIHSTGCRLSALGAYYRELALRGHI